LQVLASSCLPRQIFNFSSNLLTCCDETAKEFPSFAATHKNTCKIADKLMTIGSGEINLQSKHDLICHVAKMKAATSAHSMADVITSFSVFSIFIISLRIQHSYKTKRKYILHTNKENNIRNIVLVLMFQQLLANKHHRLHDSKFGWEESWVWSLTKKK